MASLINTEIINSFTSSWVMDGVGFRIDLYFVPLNQG